MRINNKQYGHYMSRLILHVLTFEIVPSGSGFGTVADFLSNSEYRNQCILNAEKHTLDLLKQIRQSYDNPYGNDNETIAQNILIRKKVKDTRKFVDENLLEILEKIKTKWVENTDPIGLHPIVVTLPIPILIDEKPIDIHSMFRLSMFFEILDGKLEGNKYIFRDDPRIVIEKIKEVSKNDNVKQ